MFHNSANPDAFARAALGRGLRIVGIEFLFDDFHDADEVFMSGNMSKVTPITALDDTQYQVGPIARRTREMYWDWAASNC